MRILFFSFLLLLLSSWSSSLSSSSSIFSRDSSLRNQASILISLKHSFTTLHPLFDSWKESNNMLLCSWPAIQCDPTKTLIVSIDISNFNVSGVLSPSVSHLKCLQSLSVAGNNLHGAFPSDIQKLASLRFLNISNNQFNGSLDWDFSQLKELEVLDAYDNNFSGLLPTSITELSRLKYLNLGGNYFSGRIPSSYGNQTQLNYLSLAGNDLGGLIPAELGNLTNLKQLYLGYFNEFDGGIPPELGNLLYLTHLDLASCGLEGHLPPELGRLKKLDTIFLQMNQLGGAIPSEFGNLSSLKSLDLSNNMLSGEISIELSQLQELTLLHLFINQLGGEIPQLVSDLPNLEVLNLWENNFTGTIPPKLGQNGKLIELDLSTNRLTGLVPPSLCSGRRLKILILLQNSLFGPLPNELGECVTLSRVRLGQNHLNGSIPPGFLYLPELSMVELQNNDITGWIAEEPKKVPAKLGHLNLSNNRLSGTLPTSIGNFSSLQVLLLRGNQFSGEPPSQLGLLKHLLELDLSRNNFGGRIPPELGDCLFLSYLDLSQNQFTGPFPAQIAQIQILNYLNVSWNQLNQSIPAEIASIRSLTSADFSHNAFSGQVPEIGQFKYFKPASFVGNPRLCGLYLNPCSGDQPRIKSQLPAQFELVLALGFLTCSLAFVAAAAVIITQLSKKGNPNPWKITAFQKMEFSCDDILECLKDSNIIGRGGAGIVYGGTMPNGEQIAVKRLMGTDKKGSSHDNGLSAEIQRLGRIRHRNIVRLIAFCSNKDTNLLVYEYMPNGSLAEALHGKSGRCLTWDLRLKVAAEAANGLCYLHHDCCPSILHRDVKSNNILLGSDLEARIADFGLAKFLQGSSTSECMSAMAGSYGYIAPEYASTSKAEEKSDVYSYGVVLLELLTGCTPVGAFGSSDEGIDNVVEWAKVKTNGNKEEVVKILDGRLTNVPAAEAMQVFFVAMLCVQEHGFQRPSMRQVLQMLAQLQINPTHQHMGSIENQASSSV